MMKVKELKKCLSIMLAFVLCLSFSINKIEVKADSLDQYRISTHDLALHTSQEYDPMYSFYELIITKPDSSKERKNYDEFLAMGGTYITTVPNPQVPGEYETIYTIEGTSESARILIIEDDISVVYDLNDIDQLAHKPLDLKESFNEVTLTLNGVTTKYETLDDFKSDGGIVDDSQIPNPLKAGIYPVTYSLYGEEELVNVNVTSYRISTHDFALYKSQKYNTEPSFDKLVITNSDLTKEMKTYDEFLMMGGTVETTVPTNQTPGVYKTIFTYDEISEEARVLVLEDDISVDYDVRDTEIFAHESFDIKDTFNSIIVEFNGDLTEYNTLEDFIAAGGKVDSSNMETPLKAGIYPITYSMYDTSKEVKVLVSEYKIETTSLIVESMDDFEASDSFKELTIINPDLSESKLSYEEFINEGGMVQVNLIHDDEYIITYTLNGYSVSESIKVEAPEYFDIVIDFGYDHRTMNLSIKSGETLEEPQVEPREGYLFKGWFKDKDYTERFDFNQGIDEEMHLYAKWEKLMSPDVPSAVIPLITPSEVEIMNTQPTVNTSQNVSTPNTGITSKGVISISLLLGLSLVSLIALKKRNQ